MRQRQAFTLIEMMAVLLIFGLLAVLVMPNLSMMSRRAVRQEAERLAALIELARQRSVVTSVPHRLYLDLDESAYRLDQLGGGGVEEADEVPPDPYAEAPLLLEAPRPRAQEYQPLLGDYGRLRRLDPEVLISGVQTSGGWVQRGEVYVTFDRDGGASYTLIVLANEEGEEIEIEVLPLAPGARVRRAEG